MRDRVGNRPSRTNIKKLRKSTITVTVTKISVRVPYTQYTENTVQYKLKKYKYAAKKAKIFRLRSCSGEREVAPRPELFGVTFVKRSEFKGIPI